MDIENSRTFWEKRRVPPKRSRGCNKKNRDYAKRKATPRDNTRRQHQGITSSQQHQETTAREKSQETIARQKNKGLLQWTNVKGFVLLFDLWFLLLRTHCFCKSWSPCQYRGARIDHVTGSHAIFVIINIIILVIVYPIPVMQINGNIEPFGPI